MDFNLDKAGFPKKNIKNLVLSLYDHSGHSTMTPIEHFLLRTPSPGESLPGTEAETVEDQEPEEEKTIRCRQCGHPVTLPSEKIIVDGSHAHTFANPSGILYEIGCFRSAAGCGYAGPATEEFTWFKGYGWKIAYCFRCRTHLGWLFVSPENEPFNGLILDRLSEPD
ncbi:MAG: hypothetical protein C4530_10965 [Desulfobacteraceae bacterium]|nr:MAG: hypothetical protein C4530_10965 [Desulfobacteraceae bacterium]